MSGSETVRIRRKKGWIQALLSPGRELISGSKNLNCRWIFGFAKLIVGSESVGSAANNVGSGRKCDAEPCRAVLRPKLVKSGIKLEKTEWRHGVILKKGADPKSNCRRIRIRVKKVYGTTHVDPELRYLPNPTWTQWIFAGLIYFVSLDFYWCCNTVLYF